MPWLSRKERAKLEKQGKAEKPVVGDHGKKIKEGSLDDLLWDLQLALLEADVAMPVAEEIKNGVRETLLGKRHSRDHSLEEIVETSIKESIRNVLRLNEFDFDAWFETRERPTSVMFIGINGTGKTTAIAKVAYRLINQGKTVVLAAGDTFRAGAIEQLSIHADRLGCRIVKHSPDSDPAAVAFDAIEHAKAKRRDAVLIDTAGRMQTNNNLIDEMKKIVRVAKPDLKMFVGDSLAGNDAVEQARVFDEAVGIDAVILTKIDADSKGGAALSIAHTIGKPIAFVSNGQEYNELIKFNTDWMVDRLFD
jgi:fused signal recognition particle receptor